MEPTARFDLNESLQTWRRQLQSHGDLSDEACRELEQHLKESMTALQSSGPLTDEEAFWVARHRLGSPEALRTEYVKVNSEGVWRRRILWIWLGGLLFGLQQDLHQFLVELGGRMDGIRFLSLAFALTLQFGPFALAFVVVNRNWGLSASWVENQLQSRFSAAVLLGALAGIVHFFGNFLNWEMRQLSTPYLFLLETLVEAAFTGGWVALLYVTRTNKSRAATA